MKGIFLYCFYDSIHFEEVIIPLRYKNERVAYTRASSHQKAKYKNHNVKLEFVRVRAKGIPKTNNRKLKWQK